MPVDEEPEPGKIRDSNKPMLLSAIHQYSSGRWQSVDLGIARDDPADLRAKVMKVWFIPISESVWRELA